MRSTGQKKPKDFQGVIYVNKTLSVQHFNTCMNERVMLKCKYMVINYSQLKYRKYKRSEEGR